MIEFLTLLLQSLQWLVILYFICLNGIYAWTTYLGVLSCKRYARNYSELSFNDARKLQLYKPISIIVPAYNEEKSIIASVRSFLELRYPELEVVVACDGATDKTLDLLIETFDMYPVPRVWRHSIETQPVKQVYHSTKQPNLVVINKDNGGRSDALNAALNFIRYPLFCVVDADSLFNSETLLQAGRVFLNDEEVVGVGGAIRILNGIRRHPNNPIEARVPRGWIERVQTLEYIRSFISGRAGWEAIGALMLISGAFGVFRADKVIAIGGFDPITVGEDLDLTISLHRYLIDTKTPYRFAFMPQPICWTEVPSDLTSLRRQRNRWQRGLLETLWKHRAMLFNPKYGRIGMLAVPFYWIFEAFSPILEVLGYTILLIGLLLGITQLGYAMVFLVLAALHGLVISQLSIGVEMLFIQRYNRLQDRLLLMFVPMVEFLGIHQILAFERFIATFQVRSKRGKWGQMQRKGIETSQQTVE